MRAFYCIVGIGAHLTVFALPLFLPIDATAQVSLFFSASVLSSLIPAIDARRPRTSFRLTDPILLWFILCLCIGLLYILEPATILHPLDSMLRIDIVEYRRIFWIDAIPYSIAFQAVTSFIVLAGLAIGIKRRRFIIRKSASHEDMAGKLQPIREELEKPSLFSEYFYKRLMQRSLVFLGERSDVLHYCISALTLTGRNAIYFFDFLDAEQDQTRWARFISPAQFLHSLWQTPVFQGKNLYYIQRGGESPFANQLIGDEAQLLGREEGWEMLQELNARYPLVEGPLLSSSDIPDIFSQEDQVLEIFPSAGKALQASG
ncbi:MAG: hypothetical protein KDK37_09900 [Leptospiraceae bacterium]|nr:hypothetical protein [Leptospiraceae bacterium]